MSGSRVIPSASIVVYLNGKAFGRCANFEFRSATPRKAFYGVDSLDPYELGLTQTKISGNVRVLRTVGDGGAEGAGMTVSFETLSREKYFSLMLVDRSANDAVLFQADDCSLVSQSWLVPNRGYVAGTIEFEALSWSNEVKPLGIAFAG